jgi:hypothetical protein
MKGSLRQIALKIFLELPPRNYGQFSLARLRVQRLQAMNGHRAEKFIVHRIPN